MTNLDDPTARACARFGWSWLAVFVLGGLLLEGLHGIKAAWYLEVHIRQELWRLAHAHGALLAVVNIAFAATALACVPAERSRRIAGAMLRWGALLVPAGFFLGGIGNSESDPSLAIVLTPLGALMVLHAVTVAAIGAWRSAGAGNRGG